MEPKLDKAWSKDFEPSVYNKWKEKGVYAFRKSKKRLFSIDTPPPYVNAPVHIGQTTTYCLMDMFARFHRMIGDNVLFPLGLDRNGLPIEIAAEKEFRVKLTSLSRKEAIEYCRKILEKSSMASVESFLRCGISFNSWKIGRKLGEVYETDSPDYRALTQATFVEMWNKGLIYEDLRVNNYCPGCQTTIADSEIDYEDVRTLFSDVKFKVKETGEEIIIGTTRPEFLATCERVIFNPADERYKHLEGKHAIVPIYSREVHIMAHPLAQIDKGTGLVMMCAFGDYTDIRFFREHQIKPRIAVNIDGTLNENAGFLKGLKVAEGRKLILEELKNQGLVVKQANVIHKTPVCERSKDQIEFIEMKEFYVKQVEFKGNVRELAHQAEFFAPESRQMLLDWIEAVNTDWPISRRRYYATEVPVWYCKKCHDIVLPPKGKYYQPWKDKCPAKSCQKCSNSEFEGETRVFDTWFDSSISPLYILHWSKDRSFFENSSPCYLRPQGKDIVRTWLYYTLLKCYLLTGKCIFRDVWINHHIVDEKGYKMSKSKGNTIDPKEVLDKFGAEPFRLWAAVEGNLTSTDFRCSFDRIDGAGKTIAKLWNVARFISMFPEAKKPRKLAALDSWILNELNNLVKQSHEGYAKYDFHNPVTALKHFIWETFASHYLELVKNRAYNQDKHFSEEEQQSAYYALHECLSTVLKLLAPVLPMLTYKLYLDLHAKDIHSEKFPKLQKAVPLPFNSTELMELNSAIWKMKKDKGLSLKAEIPEASIPEKFKIIEKDFVRTHSVRNMNYGELKIHV